MTNIAVLNLESQRSGCPGSEFICFLYLYPFLKELQFNIIEEVGGEKREKPIDLLTWNESTNWVTNMATEMYQDSQVQVILAGETGKWR